MNTRLHRIFMALAMLLLLSPTLLFAQNLIVNGDFEQTSGFDYQTISDYTRIWSGGVAEGQFIHAQTTTGHSPGGLGWPSNLVGYNGSGYYLLFNGFGGSINPTKAAWRQTVAVTANTTYTFSAQVRNLSQAYMGVNPNPAQLRLKINGQQVGADLTLPTHNNWIEWSNTWNSGSTTQAIIEIFDVFSGEAWTGDDFGLDHLSFVPEAVYSVTANNDVWPLACYGTSAEIPVLDNDIISPGLQNITVQILGQPSHGEAYYLSSNHKIEYICTDNSFSGTDSFQYRVGFPAQNIFDEAWVYVTVGHAPIVANITAQGPICAGGALNIPTPSVNPSTAGQWEKSTAQNGTFTSFDPNNIPLSMNGNWVRYSASNDCGEGHSNAVQITVTNGPSFSAQTPQIQPICAGGSLNITAPAYNSNGSQILSQGWVASQTENGTYTTFNNNSLNNIPASYNGWYIRYMVEGSCGFVYSNPPRLLTVNVAPDITGTIQAPPAICAGEDLEVTPPSYDGNGTGAWEICQTQNGTYQPFNPQNVPSSYNNWYLHYKVSNNCGSDVSNIVQIHVNDAPIIATPTTPQAICAGGSFNLTTPTIQNNGATITDQGWQIAATQNGPYNAFNNNNVPYTYNNYWIRYFAVNECGESHSVSVQVTVNDEPLVSNITAPSPICAGETFNLITPQVTWRHVNQGTGSWEIQIDGVWQTLNNSNIPFAYNGCNIRYKAVNGCGTAYSSNNVQVTVYSTEPTYDTITACDTYVWNGVPCNHTGNYQAQVQNANGCTITANLYFIMSDAYTETQTVSECFSYTWPKNGVNYTSTGIYDYTVESGNPLVCDSIFTLNLTINNAPQIMGDISSPSDICSGNPLSVMIPQYEMNHSGGGDAHWEYATSSSGPFTAFDPSTINLGYGTYYLRFAVVNDCGSDFSNVVQFHVNGTPEIEGQLSAFQVCENNPLDLPEVNVEWMNTNENDRVGEWQMANTQNGSYAGINPTMLMQMSHNGCWIRYYAHTSCGTDILGPVPITVLSVEDQWLETITECDFYQLPSGEIITESQVVEYEVLEPCFYIIHQPVVINHSDYVVDPITSCHDDYVWHGHTFHRSEQTQYAWDTLQNTSGCDSIVELNLDFGDYSIYVHNRIACDSYEWEMNPGHVYYETQRDSVFVPAVGTDDCDTWYFLELTVGHNSLIDGGSMTECSGFVWYGIPYYEDAILYDSLQTPVTHCDSIIFYNLTITPPIFAEESIESCQPIWWQDHLFEEDGEVFTVTLISPVTGCDSIVTMHFSLADEIVHEFDTVACEPFTWFEYECNINGMICSHQFQTPMGCDSTVIKHVYLNTTEMSTQFIAACDFFEYNGVVYDEPGVTFIDVDTIFSEQGCDSIVRRIRLEIKDSEHIGLISGLSNVYVASNLFSGIYRYEVNPEEVQDDIVWSLSNSDWQIIEAQDNYCRIFVTTPGTSTLTASFRTPDCGEIVREFVINAGFFGVGEKALEVNVFPNPTKGTVTVEAEGIESIRLTNMMGQVLEVRECDRSDSVMLNLNGYAPSIYLLEIKTVNGAVKKRLVLCR